MKFATLLALVIFTSQITFASENCWRTGMSEALAIPLEVCVQSVQKLNTGSPWKDTRIVLTIDKSTQVITTWTHYRQEPIYDDHGGMEMGPLRHVAQIYSGKKKKKNGYRDAIVSVEIELRETTPGQLEPYDVTAEIFERNPTGYDPTDKFYYTRTK